MTYPYVHYAGPSYGGLDVIELPYLPIREREKGLKGQVISEADAIQLLVYSDLKSKSRFIGAKDSTTIRSA